MHEIPDPPRLSLDPPVDEPVARRYSGRVRASLTTLLVTSCALAAAYRLLVAGRLEQTSALFLGLPLLLGLLVVQLTRARSVYGEVVRANFVFLAIVAPLLGEGSVCLLMAAPLFLGASLLVTLVAVALANHVMRSRLAIVFVPLLWGVAERHAGVLQPEPVVVRTEHRVEGDLAAWRAAVRSAAPVAESTDWFLSLGFPLPVAYAVEGDRVRVDFSPSEGTTGSWTMAREETEDGVRFAMERDSTKVAHWMEVVAHRVAVRPAAGGGVEIVQETEFVPRLSPQWYFVPMQRSALARAQSLALRCWSAAVDER